MPHITPTSTLAPVTPLDPDSLGGSSTQTSAGSAFKDVLSSAINEVEGARAGANQTIDKFLAGEGEDLHSTILASQRADLEFQMFMQVRNKVVSAYQEIMKMPM
jgi:flagellar hook-basal body complex protein FliE